jgi:hypothetical protein
MPPKRAKRAGAGPPKRGRPAIYQPAVITEEDLSVKVSEPSTQGKKRAVKLLRDFYLLNRESDSTKTWTISKWIKTFGAQQLRQGMDPASVTTCLEHVQHVSIAMLEEPAALTERMELTAFKIGLKRTKARGGNKAAAKKPLRSPAFFDRLFSLTKSKKGTVIDTEYRAFMFLLVCSGNRPANIRTASARLTKTCLRIKFCGRKTEECALSSEVEFPFSWTLSPAADIVDVLKNGVPTIGTEFNVASCIDSWIKRYTGLKTDCPTSTWPRVSLDNTLSKKVREGKMTESEFKRVMNHGLTVSDTYYRR